MTDLTLKTTLTADASQLNATLRQSAQGVQQLGQTQAQVARSTTSAQAAQAAYTNTTRSARAEANQLTQAYRQLPAQITDITTSLVSGMPIWKVAVQQGGKIKDSFGGIGPALRGVAAAINPVTLAFGAVAAVVRVALLAYNRGAAEADAYTRAIVLSGNAAGTTRTQMAGMARSIDQVVGTQAQAAEALAATVASGRVVRQNLELVATVAVRMQRETGAAIKDTVAEYAALGKEPVAASRRLNEQYNHLTVAVYEQIRALERRGEVEQAGVVAQRALATAQTSMTAELEANLGHIEGAWRKVKQVAAETWDAMLGIGRKGDLETQLEKAKQGLATLERVAANSLTPRNEKQDAAQRAAAQQRIADLQQLIYLEGERAVADQERADAMRRHLAAEAAREAAAKKAEDAAKAAADAVRRVTQDLRDRLTVYGEELRLGGQLNEVQRLELELRQQLAAMQREHGKAAADSARALAQQVVARARDVAAQREQIRSEEEAADVAAKAADAALREADALAQENQRMREQLQTLGQNAAARTVILQARLSSLIALKEQNLAELEAAGVYNIQTTALREQIEELKERQRVLGALQVRGEEVAWAEQLRRQAEMERQQDEMRREGIATSIAEGIASGTLSAKQLWDIFRTELVREFARTTLTPQVRPIVDAAFDWIKMGITALGAWAGGSGGNVGFGSASGGGVMHGGGVVGVDRPQAMRMLPASSWASAPRLHKGMLASDEFPAVLQRGESVLTPGQLRAVAGMGGQQVVQNITYNVPPGQSPEAYAAALEANNQRLKGEMVADMARPGRPMQRAAAAARF